MSLTVPTGLSIVNAIRQTCLFSIGPTLTPRTKKGTSSDGHPVVAPSGVLSAGVALADLPGRLEPAHPALPAVPGALGLLAHHHHHRLRDLRHRGAGRAAGGRVAVRPRRPAPGPAGNHGHPGGGDGP